MKSWEIDVEMRVRKTFVFEGPTTPEAARQVMIAILDGSLSGVPMMKWEPDGYGCGRHPVETIIDNQPVIVAMREVPE